MGLIEFFEKLHITKIKKIGLKIKYNLIADQKFNLKIKNKKNKTK